MSQRIPLNGLSLFYSGDLRGHGLISALGGQGDGVAGGGSGGRIALHSVYDNQYRGYARAYGHGGTGGGDIGGPGSVFMEDMLVRGITWENRLYVDGQNVDIPKPLVVYEKNPRVLAYSNELDNNADVSFDHVMLMKKVFHCREVV